MYNNQPEKYIAAVFTFGERTGGISSSTSTDVKRFLGAHGIASLVSPAQYVIIIPHEGVLRNLFWNAETSTLNANANSFTIFVNGLATSLIAAWDLAALSGNNTLEAVNVNPGDQVSVEINISRTPSGVENIFLPTVSFELEVEPDPNYMNQWNWNTAPARLTFIGGKVGIGTANPQALLDLAGPLKIKDGTEGAGKLLTSDVNGLAAWSDPLVPPGIHNGDILYWKAGVFKLLPPGNERDCLVMIGGFPSWVKVLPTIYVSSTQLNFDKVAGLEATLLIQNSGPGNLLISGISIDNSCFFISDLPNFPFEILPQGTRLLTVKCSAPDIQNGTLTIQNSDPANPAVNISLLATILPEIEVIPVNLVFNNNAGIHSELLIRNKGLGTLTITGINSNNPSFVIGALPASQVPPGGEETLIIDCISLTSASGTLTIHNSDPGNATLSIPMDAVITGRIGIGPCYAFDIHTTRQQAFQIQNTGYGILDVNGILFDNPCFTLVHSHTFPIQIQPQQQLLIWVNCSATNSQDGWMTIQNSDPVNGSFRVRMMTTTGRINVTPGQFVFNAVTGFTANLMIDNYQGSIPLSITGLTIDNPTFFFSMAPPSLPFKVGIPTNPRGQQWLFLSCYGSGYQTGTLTISSTDLDHPVTLIPLTAVMPQPVSTSSGGGEHYK